PNQNGYSLAVFPCTRAPACLQFLKRRMLHPLLGANTFSRVTMRKTSPLEAKAASLQAELQAVDAIRAAMNALRETVGKCREAIATHPELGAAFVEEFQLF